MLIQRRRVDTEVEALTVALQNASLPPLAKFFTSETHMTGC